MWDAVKLFGNSLILSRFAFKYHLSKFSELGNFLSGGMYDPKDCSLCPFQFVLTPPSLASGFLHMHLLIRTQLKTQKDPQIFRAFYLCGSLSSLALSPVNSSHLGASGLPASSQFAWTARLHLGSIPLHYSKETIQAEQSQRLTLFVCHLSMIVVLCCLVCNV